MELTFDPARRAFIGRGPGRFRSQQHAKLTFVFRLGSETGGLHVHIKSREGDLRFVATEMPFELPAAPTLPLGSPVDAS